MLEYRGSVSKTVDGSNKTNGYIEIQMTYPSNVFLKTMGVPKVISDFLHPSVETTDPKDCCTYKGKRDQSLTGCIFIVGLASTTNIGDNITVDYIAWQSAG